MSNFDSCFQANSRKRKPRSKKSKTLKPSKADEVMKSTSSEPSPDKRSDDEDEVEEEKVHFVLVLFFSCCFINLNVSKVRTNTL